MYIEWQPPEQRIARWRKRIWNTVQTARLAAEFSDAGAADASDDSARLAALGWHALHQRQMERAEKLFRAALHQDPYAISAWFGLSRAVEEPERRREYLQAAFDLQFLVNNLERTR